MAIIKLFVNFHGGSIVITKPLYYFMVELSHMILAVGITMPRWSWLSACRKNELFLCMFITNHASGHQKNERGNERGNEGGKMNLKQEEA